MRGSQPGDAPRLDNGASSSHAAAVTRKVGLRELRKRLSEYVRQVRGGDVVLVTDRGQIVAELHPPGSSAAPADITSGLLELARRGSLTLGGPNHPGLYPRLPRLLAPGEFRRLLDEERGDR